MTGVILYYFERLLYEAKKIEKELTLIPKSRLFDLTPNRYLTFQKYLGESPILYAVLTGLKTKYPKHTENLLLNLVADVIYKSLSNEENKRLETLRNQVEGLLNELSKNEWPVTGWFPIYNVLWIISDAAAEEEEIKFPLIPKYNVWIFGGSSAEVFSDEMNTRKNVSAWGIMQYKIKKSVKEYCDLLNIPKALEIVWISLLGLRLFMRGDVGTDFVLCKLSKKPTFHECECPIDLIPSSEFQPDNYVILYGTEAILTYFCNQLENKWSIISKDKSSKIACQNFMISYSQSYLNRTETYMRILQAIFKQKRKENITRVLCERVSTFFGRSKKEKGQIQELIKKTFYSRSDLTHGRKSLSEVRDLSFYSNPILEQYCREAIFFQMCLSLQGKNKTLKTLSLDEDVDTIRQLRCNSQDIFWEGSRLKIFKKGEDVPLRLWCWDQ